MPRVVSDARAITALKSDDFNHALLLKIQFARGTQYWTDYGHPLIHAGDIYSSVSSFISVSSVSDSTDITVGSFLITAQNVDKSTMAVVLTQPISGRRVDVWRAMIDDDGSIIDVFGVQLNSRMSSWTAAENSETATVTIEAASHWADFNRTAGRRTTPASQQRFFPNDTAFEFAHSIVKPVKWGSSQ